jgi:hypothetical protein
MQVGGRAKEDYAVLQEVTPLEDLKNQAIT